MHYLVSSTNHSLVLYIINYAINLHMCYRPIMETLHCFWGYYSIPLCDSVFPSTCQLFDGIG